jgi:hypothetical protein
MAMRDQISPLLLDGLFTNPSPVFLWVSADPGKLDDAVARAAVRIVEGSAPDVLEGRRLLRADAAGLLAALRDADLPPIDQMEATLRELEQSGTALALDRPELLGEADMAFDPADALCTALANGRIGCFIGLTNPPGLDRLRDEQPRLLMLAQVFELDTGSSYQPGSLVLPVWDPAEAGWLILVRCRLLAPVDELDDLAKERSPSQLRAAKELDAIGIDHVLAVPTEVGIAGVIISVRADAANIEEESTAEAIALAGTQQLIRRPLGEGERLEVTRRVYLELKADPPYSAP